MVNVVAANDEFCDVSDGDITKLKSNAAAGAGQILWQADIGGTGNMWALVRLGNTQAKRPFYVRLEVYDGENGSVDLDGTIHDATYRYNAIYPDTGGTLATALTPYGNRVRGPLTGPAQQGELRTNPDGSYRLFWTDEQS